MRYHLILKYIEKVVIIAKTFFLNLAVWIYMSTSVASTLGQWIMSINITKFEISGSRQMADVKVGWWYNWCEIQIWEKMYVRKDHINISNQSCPNHWWKKIFLYHQSWSHHGYHLCLSIKNNLLGQVSISFQ